MAEIRFCDSCEGSMALGEPSMEQDGKLYCAPCWRALFGPAENPAEHKPTWVAPPDVRRCDSCRKSIANGEEVAKQDGRLYCAECWMTPPREYEPPPQRETAFRAKGSAFSSGFGGGLGCLLGVLLGIVLLAVILFGGCAGCLSMVS